MSTGYVWHELYGWHDTGSNAGLLPGDASLNQPYFHFESPESKQRFASLAEVSGLAEHLVRLNPEPVSDEDILRCHTPEHLARLKRESEAPRGGDAGDGTSPFGHGGLEIARLAVGGTVAALDAVLDGLVTNAYALVRPPGHHARPETGMGFCMLGNAAIAVARARSMRPGLRVVTMDWDVHHGNGTQSIFWEDPDVLTISLHQDGLFPANSGHVTERGEGRGEGYAINVPLPAGTGNGGYLHALEQVVVPAVRRYRPDVIVIPSGFDASCFDPLGRMAVTADGFRAMTRVMMELADDVCEGRLVLTHEGGYSPVYVPLCGVSVLSELSGVDVDVIHPLYRTFDEKPECQLTDGQRAAVAAARVAADVEGKE
ncbi:MAG: class II histone deacetylase [Actinomycetales bacterium]|nr:class II histone deacetylase [Actinomycetales bacterium]